MNPINKKIALLLLLILPLIYTGLIAQKGCNGCALVGINGASTVGGTNDCASCDSIGVASIISGDSTLWELCHYSAGVPINCFNWWDTNNSVQIGTGCGDIDFLGAETIPSGPDLNGTTCTTVNRTYGNACGTFVVPDFDCLNLTGGGSGTAGPQGIPGEDGINCWDLNNDGIDDASEDTNGDGLFNSLDCQSGAGSNGIPGINCWDLNGDGVDDTTEDTNGDGVFNALDCNGMNCWDTNGNGIADPSEDTNLDGKTDIFDCSSFTSAGGCAGIVIPENDTLITDTTITITQYVLMADCTVKGISDCKNIDKEVIEYNLQIDPMNPDSFGIFDNSGTPISPQLCVDSKREEWVIDTISNDTIGKLLIHKNIACEVDSCFIGLNIQTFFQTVNGTVPSPTEDSFRGEQCGLTFTGFNEVNPSAPIDVRRGEAGKTVIQNNDCSNNLLHNPNDVAYTGIGIWNISIGGDAGQGATVVNSNTFLGRFAGGGANVTSGNLFTGLNTARNSTFLGNNSFFGTSAAANATGQDFNIGAGFNTLVSATMANSNSFWGSSSGRNMIANTGNGGFGAAAFQDADLNDSNYAFGTQAGNETTAIDFNLFGGVQSGQFSTFGTRNSYWGISTASGTSPTSFSTHGNSNIGIGDNAAFESIALDRNIFLGFQSGRLSNVGNDNSFIGPSTNTLAGAIVNESTAIGYHADIEHDNQIVIGNKGIDGGALTQDIELNFTASYATTAAAAADVNLLSGEIFKIDNGDGTSQIHIKN